MSWCSVKKELLLKLLAWERAYKDGDEASVIELMQDLIDTGDIHLLKPTIRDRANLLIEYGLCSRPTLKVVK